MTEASMHGSTVLEQRRRPFSLSHFRSPGARFRQHLFCHDILGEHKNGAR